MNTWVLVRGGHQKVLWYIHDDNIGPAVVARKDPRDEYWFAGDSEADFAASSTLIEYVDPTHWMPIPEYIEETENAA
jgi:hypothetical protein